MKHSSSWGKRAIAAAGGRAWRSWRERRAGVRQAMASRRGPVRVLAVLLACALVAPVTMLAMDVRAEAASNVIPVGFDVVDAKSDAALEAGHGQCQGLPAGGMIGAFDEDADTGLPQDRNGSSFISAHYVRDGVDLKIKAITVKETGDGDYLLMLTPEVPVTMQASQNRVALTIKASELGSADGQDGKSSLWPTRAPSGASS